MNMIIFIILICSKILIAHSARCGWKPYDMEYEIKQYFAGSKKRVSKKRKQKTSRKSSKK